MKKYACNCLLLASVLGAVPASMAHHSFAMFDFEKVAQIEGVVREMRFAAPHVWLYVTVTDPAKGTSVEYGVEGAAPNSLLRAGWKRDSIRSGDRVKVTIHPLRTGEPGGSLMAISVNGRELGNAP
jgi:Family of unknown function (DUF6152)